MRERQEWILPVRNKGTEYIWPSSQQVPEAMLHQADGMGTWKVGAHVLFLVLFSVSTTRADDVMSSLEISWKFKSENRSSLCNHGMGEEEAA